jgi:hypothetical protein
MYRSSVASSYHWSNKARPFFSCMTTKDYEFNSFKKNIKNLNWQQDNSSKALA